MIASDSADAVAAIHVLEHFYRWEVEPILTEWKRILKPGGVLILELPCMNKIGNYMAWCVQNNQDMLPFMSLHALYGDEKHQDPAMCHKWGWFVKPLEDVLHRTGFSKVESCTPKYHFPFRDMRFECTK